MKGNKYVNWKVILILIIVLIIGFFSTIVNLLADYKWYSEVGYTGVFFTRIFTQFKLAIPIFIVLIALIFPYLLYLKGQYVKHSKVIYSKENLKSVNNKLFLSSAVLSLLISILISSTYWYEILKFINASSFNVADPLFNKDVSFYVFKLPLFRAIYSLGFGILVILTIVTIGFYLFTSLANSMAMHDDNVLRMGRKPRLELGKEIIESAGSQLAFLVSSILIMIGIGYIFKSYDLVYSPRGVAFGASYTDVNVTLLFNRILMGLSILAAASIFYALIKKKVKMTLWIVGIMVGASIIQAGVEFGVQQLIVSPNEINKEEPFIKYNIEYTKLAYGLDRIEEKDFPAEQTLTSRDLSKNKATVENIRINDFAPAMDVYNQLQGIRPYYRFNDIDIDRYNINGKYTQVFIAPRELEFGKLDPNSQTWINGHLIYTHGYGIAMSPVNTVTEQGQPNLIIKDIPPISSVDIGVERPQIYFGETSSDYIITNTRRPEMDYPSGDTNVGTFYEGKAGISLGGLNRFLFMINRGSFNFLLSQDITSESRIIMHRNIKERVQKIAPFLSYDNDPYIVLKDGKLYWIIDAYTTSSAYPYSEPYGGINYIRNSVKVIIDAYDGTTDFYIVDENDPMAVTYSNIFPGLFKKVSDMDQGFIEHFRYPQDIFTYQTEVYKKYHMTDPSVFYSKEDSWAVAGESQSPGQQGTQTEPSYIVMKLPEGEEEEFILVTPYTPIGKDNMVAWLGARMDGENYGKLILYKFPKQKMTYGPSQFAARVNQDSVISKELSLWDQQGSDVITGNVIITPIENSLLYVMPVYIRSTGTNSIPEMKRVIVGYGDRIIMEQTLSEALSKMFGLGETVEVPEDETPPSVDNPPVQVETDSRKLIEQANDAFVKAKEAQQRGDWAEYGKQLKVLEDILKQLGTTVQ